MEGLGWASVPPPWAWVMRRSIVVGFYVVFDFDRVEAGRGAIVCVGNNPDL